MLIYEYAINYDNIYVKNCWKLKTKEKIWKPAIEKDKDYFQRGNSWTEDWFVNRQKWNWSSNSIKWKLTKVQIEILNPNSQ